MIISFWSEISKTLILLDRQRELLQQTNRILAEFKSKPSLTVDNLAEFKNNGAVSTSALPEQSYQDSFYKELFRTQEAERARIARELHDEFGQAITAIYTEIELACREGLDPDSPLAIRIQHIKELLEHTGHEIQRLAYDLRPAALDHLGLSAALMILVEDIRERNGIQISFNNSKEVGTISKDIELAFYRVAQEALTNVVKHADAAKVNIALKRLRTSLRLEVKDNGVGFNISTLYNKGRLRHMGLWGMRERLRLLGGELIINSRPGSGTQLFARVPLH
ncbi:MAG: sensor histidine kinase [Acidobacteriota bacterium]